LHPLDRSTHSVLGNVRETSVTKLYR
jgi:hypothetical protein